MTTKTTLNYLILNPRQNISLNIFETEKYEPAIIAQQLVGTLVYFSNFGRCEPRLAEQWIKTDDYTWKFKLKKNIFCENGETITPTSFKKSLERSLFIYEKLGGIPILSSLNGYSKFQSANKDSKNVDELIPIEGLSVEDDQLVFKFDKKIKNGLLQILAFTPFGYICSGNFKSDGTWTNDAKFISSGPYQVDNIKIGEYYKLVRNKHWDNFAEGSPDEIIFTHDAKQANKDIPTIIDAFTNEYTNEEFQPFQLIPEYLNTLLLGNTTNGYFSNKEIRQNFKKFFNNVSTKTLPEKFGINIRSSTFYPNQQIKNEPSSPINKLHLPIPTKPLVIEGKIPNEGSSRWYSWKVLKSTLDELNFPYKFANNESTFIEITNKNYDIRLRGSSIGGGVEAWGLYVLFCSSVGFGFPDPDGKVCKLIAEHEDEKITDAKLASEFFSSIEDQAAILPVSHYGVNMHISRHLDTRTFSPLMSIMKFDQISIGK